MRRTAPKGFHRLYEYILMSGRYLSCMLENVFRNNTAPLGAVQRPAIIDNPGKRGKVCKADPEHRPLSTSISFSL